MENEERHSYIENGQRYLQCKGCYDYQKVDDKYQCPDYCGVKHIHKIHSDSKPLTFDKKSKIKIYLQK